MINEYYLSARPDYFPTDYSQEEYQAILTEIEMIAPGRTLCLSDKGLSSAGKVYSYWQKFKGLIGFTDFTQKERVNAEFLKILFYGRGCGFESTSIERISKKIAAKHICVDDKVAKVVDVILNKSMHSSEKDQIIVSCLNDYFITNQANLNPSFWNWLFGCDRLINLPSNPQFGDTCLAIAKQLKNNWDKEDEMISWYLKAIQWGKNEEEYSNRLFDSWSSFIQNYDSIKGVKKFSNVTRRLAEREFWSEDYGRTITLLDNVLEFTPDLMKDREWMIKMIAHDKKNQMDSVEKCIVNIKEENVPAEFKKEFGSIACRLGNHLRNKVNAISTKLIKLIHKNEEKYDHKALRYYTLALPYLPVQEQYKLIPTMLELIDQMTLTEQELKIYFDLGTYKLSKNDHLRSILILLVAIRGNKEKLNATSCSAMWYLAEAVASYLGQGGSKNCSLILIDRALDYRGDVKKQFSRKGLFSKDYQCTNPSIISDGKEKMPGFTVEMGSALHFLKGELMSILKFPVQEILAEYKLAVDLASGNPFASQSVFMVDEQTSGEDNLQNLIASYRGLAIDWGSPPEIRLTA